LNNTGVINAFQGNTLNLTNVEAYNNTGFSSIVEVNNMFTLNIISCKFENNSCSNTPCAGAIYFNNTNTIILDTIITNNQGYFQGSGGIYCGFSNLQLEDAFLFNNSSPFENNIICNYCNALDSCACSNVTGLNFGIYSFSSNCTDCDVGICGKSCSFTTPSVLCQIDSLSHPNSLSHTHSTTSNFNVTPKNDNIVAIVVPIVIVIVVIVIIIAYYFGYYLKRKHLKKDKKSKVELQTISSIDEYSLPKQQIIVETK